MGRGLVERTALIGGALALVASLLIVGGASVSSAAPVPDADWVVTEWTVGDTSHPKDVAVDPSGVVWSTLQGANTIDRLDPATGTTTSFPVPTPSAYVNGIAIGPDGRVWFAETDGLKIGALDPASGSIAEYPIPDDGAAWSITNGPDGNLWFTDPKLGRVGSVTTSGTITMHPLPAADSQPIGIAAGADGNLWVGLSAADEIARVTPAGVVTTYPTAVPGSIPGDVAATSDGRIAVALDGIAAVLFVDLDGTIEPVALDDDGFRVAAITAGPDGSIWATINETGVHSSGSALIGQITPAGSTTAYSLVTSQIGVAGIATSGDAVWFAASGSGRIAALSFGDTSFTGVELPAGVDAADVLVDRDGDVWFSDYWAGRIGRLDPETGAIDLFTIPVAGSAPIGLAVDHDGQIWFADYRGDAIGTLDPTSGEFTVHPLTPGAAPSNIIVGPDAAIWFTEEATGSIGRLDPATGAITQIPIGTGADPDMDYDLTTGPDGAVWVSASQPGEQLGSRTYGLARVAADGTVEFHPLPPASDAVSLSSSPTELLFATLEGASVGAMTTDGTATTVGTFHPNRGITNGPDGNAWYGGFIGSRLGTVTGPTSLVERLPGGAMGAGSSTRQCAATIDPQESCPIFYDVATGRSGELWLSTNQHRLLRYDLEAGLVVTGLDGPDTAVPGQTVSVTFEVDNRGPQIAGSASVDVHFAGGAVTLTGDASWSCSGSSCTKAQLGVDTASAFTATAVVPADLPTTQVLDVDIAASALDANTATASHDFRVDVPTPGPVPASDVVTGHGTLPATGSRDALTLTVIAVGLIAGGAVLVAVRRRA